MKLNLYIIIIVVLPILGAVVAGFLGRKLGVKGSQFITVTSLFISSLLISDAFYQIVLCGGESINLNLGSWVDTGILTINWEFKFDNLSISLGLAVLYCSTLIHIYSISYLESDPAKCFGKTLLNLWVKLSNSGKPLKLLIPNYIFKKLSGWTNYSGRVTIQKIQETEMGNRGSKSLFFSNIVKEQRVYDSYLFLKPLQYKLFTRVNKLRCTLKGYENNYQIKNPTNQLKKFSTLNKNLISPWFWTGLIETSFNKNIKYFSIKRYNNLYSVNTSLVIWGKILPSLIGYGKLTNKVRILFEIPYYYKNVIIGLLLSDGWLTFGSKASVNARLGFKQSLNHFPYFLSVFNLLSHYCNSMPHLIINNREGKIHYGLGLFTRSLPCFTEFHSLFYKNGIKIIPNNIYELLTPVALAHWVMGDGVAKSHGLILCTDSYPIKDVVRLINVLIIKYRLECTIRVHKENQYRIYIRQKSMPLLIKIIKSHIHPSMLYKLNLKS